MSTVKSLIEQLKTLDPKEGIVFQYFTAEHANLDEDEFKDVAEYLMGNDQFATDASEVFRSWITEAVDVIATNYDEDEE